MKCLAGIIPLFTFLACMQPATNKDKNHSADSSKSASTSDQPSLKHDHTSHSPGDDFISIAKIMNEQQRLQTIDLDSAGYSFKCPNTTAGKLTYYTESGALRKIAIDWPKKGNYMHSSEYFYKPSLYLVRETQQEGPERFHVRNLYLSYNKVIKVTEDGKDVDCGDCENALDSFPSSLQSFFKHKAVAFPALCQESKNQ